MEDHTGLASASLPDDPSFPTVQWAAWECDATFLPSDTLPPADAGLLYAALVFVFYGDRLALADIEGRGLTIPSGRIEPGETPQEAAVREVWEEVGGHLGDQLHLIGSYRLVARVTTDSPPCPVRWCPVFIAEALGFEPIPTGSESRGLHLAAREDIADLYFTWDPLMDAVFTYAETQRKARLPIGPRLSEIFPETS